MGKGITPTVLRRVRTGWSFVLKESHKGINEARIARLKAIIVEDKIISYIFLNPPIQGLLLVPEV